MNREVDVFSEQRIKRINSRNLMLNVMERISRNTAGGPRSALPDEGEVPNVDLAFGPEGDVPIEAGVTDARLTNEQNFGGVHSWGGFANGRIPTAEMVKVTPNGWLETNAAKSLQQMRGAAGEAGLPFVLVSAYRDYPSQVRVRAGKGDEVATATPGSSVHGWGRAIDVSGEATQAWMRENGRRYGWIWPTWAQRPGKSFEPWHFEFVGTNTASAEPKVESPEEKEERRANIPEGTG